MRHPLILMSARFAQSLRSYLERTNTRAIDLERLAQLPNATVAKLITGQRPSVERLGGILHCIDPGEAAELLRSYITDAVPPDWISRVTLTIDVPSPAPKPVRDSLSRAISGLHRAAEADPSLAAWVTNTARVLNLTDPDSGEFSPPQE